MTGRDLGLARTISALAADAGLTPPRRPRPARTGPGHARRGGGRAVLGRGATATHAPDDGDEVVDAAGALPTIWFQQSGRDEPRQRWHHDLWVDPAEVQPRIDAAVAAGGTLVSDAEAPSFWVLADPEGNRSACARGRNAEP